jgi:hypothetical protein
MAARDTRGGTGDDDDDDDDDGPTGQTPARKTKRASFFSQPPQEAAPSPDLPV